MIQAKILCDSINPDGDRLSTIELTMPRYALAEFNTHRLFARNAASSRAVPVKRMREMCMHTPITPHIWGQNQKGMQSFELVPEAKQPEVERIWKQGARYAAEMSEKLEKLGLHKQWANRPMEAFLPTTVIFSATQLGNFFNLRAHVAALPDFGQAAYQVLQAVHNSTPRPIAWGDWHIPFSDRMPQVNGCELELGERLKVATARCARLSYLTYDGLIDVVADFRIHDDLATNGHWSPFEHCAMAQPWVPQAFKDLQEYAKGDAGFEAQFITPLIDKVHEDHSPYRGWKPYRKNFAGEHQWHYDYGALMANKPDWVKLDDAA